MEPAQHFWRRHALDVAVALVLLLGTALVYGGRHVVPGSSRAGPWVVTAGALLVLAAIVGAFYRLRWWHQHTPSLVSTDCPRCGAQLRRVRRRRHERWLSRIVPVRRYRCPNATCLWKGLRVWEPGREASGGNNHQAHKRDQEAPETTFVA